MKFPSNGSNANDFLTKKETITNVQIKYNVATPYNPEKINDVEIKISCSPITSNGKTFTPEFYINGKFKRDITGEIVGIGTMFKVETLFEAALGTRDIFVDDFQSQPDNYINNDLVYELIGKEIYTLRYKKSLKPDGTIKWQTYDLVGNKPERIVKDFLKSVDKGYVTIYNETDLHKTSNTTEAAPF